MNDFRRTVSDLFELGVIRAFAEFPYGNANRLWTFETDTQSFIVKEFRYTVSDTAWVSAIRSAAEFEYKIWQTGQVTMADPVRTIDDEFIPIVTGSRGKKVAIRVHRRLIGTKAKTPVSTDVATAAGYTLSTIQLLGRNYLTRNRKSLRWWRWNPKVIISSLRARGLANEQLMQRFLSILPDAEELISSAEGLDGACIYSHYDFKPENILFTSSGLAVLDWDEASLCHPRLEAIEAAFLWSFFGRGESCPDVFAAFMEGYRRNGKPIEKITRTDFGKWTAAKVGWIEYLGRRALGEFAETESEISEATRRVELEIEFFLKTLSVVLRLGATPNASQQPYR